MSVFKRGDYVRLYAIACDLHSCTTNSRVRENAAELMDLLVLVLGEYLHRPRGMRGLEIRFVGTNDHVETDKGESK